MRCPPLSHFLADPPTARALAWIREMRGYNYQHYYLKSRLWKEVIRAKVMQRDQYRCTVCGRYAKGVHHLSYDEATLLGRDLTHLKSICHDHHDASHFGDPALELGPLTARFREVKKEQRTKERLRLEFLSLGGELRVTALPARSWYSLKLWWKFAHRHEEAARDPNRFFYLGAARALKLNYFARTTNGNKGTKLRQQDGKHCATFFFDAFAPFEGLIRLREASFPDWTETLKALTSEHPFPVVITRDDLVIAKSSGNRANRHLA